MKYCVKCAKELFDEAVICPGCGCQQNTFNVNDTIQNNEKKSSPASIVLGIVGILSAWLFALAGHVVSIIGIVFGVKEYKNSGKMTGLVLSLIGEVCAIFSSIIGATIVSNLF